MIVVIQPVSWIFLVPTTTWVYGSWVVKHNGDICSDQSNHTPNIINILIPPHWLCMLMPQQPPKNRIDWNVTFFPRNDTQWPLSLSTTIVSRLWQSWHCLMVRRNACWDGHDSHLLIVLVIVREEFCTFAVVGPSLVVGGGQLPRPIAVTATIG